MSLSLCGVCVCQFLAASTAEGVTTTDWSNQDFNQTNPLELATLILFFSVSLSLFSSR